MTFRFNIFKFSDPNLRKSSSFDRSPKPIHSTVYVNIGLKRCKSLPSLPPMHLEEDEGEYYNAGKLTFKYQKLKEFSIFCLICVFNFK